MTGLSPLANFLCYPLFQEAVRLDNFNNWKIAGKTQFVNLGKETEMHSIQVLAQQIGNSPRLEYQYRQIQSLVAQLLVSSNVLLPLTAFEQVLLSEKKKMSKIYFWKQRL